jgi:hypothetical protein
MNYRQRIGVLILLLSLSLCLTSQVHAYGLPPTTAAQPQQTSANLGVRKCGGQYTNTLRPGAHGSIGRCLCRSIGLQPLPEQNVQR